MKKRRKGYLLVIIGLLAAWAAWVIYFNVSSRLTTIDTEIYTIGDIVPCEDDRIGGYTPTPGYEFRVDGFQLLDTQPYLESIGNPVVRNVADKLAIVTITLFNRDSDAQGIMLPDLQLHGIDNYAGINYVLLNELNPKLDNNPGIQLPRGEYIELKLPYDLFKDHYGAYTWKHIDEYPMYLRISVWPTTKDIRVN